MYTDSIQKLESISFNSPLISLVNFLSNLIKILCVLPRGDHKLSTSQCFLASLTFLRSLNTRKCPLFSVDTELFKFIKCSYYILIHFQVDFDNFYQWQYNRMCKYLNLYKCSMVSYSLKKTTSYFN